MRMSCPVMDAVQKKGDVKCDVTNESDGKGESHELVVDAEQKQGDVKDRSDENNVKEKNTVAGEDDKGTGSDKEAAEKDMLEGHVDKVLRDETVSCDETSYIEIKPVQSIQLTGVVNLSGQYVQDASTGTLYNIDDLDISQLTQIYLIDVPQKETEIKTTETNYRILAIVEDVEVKTEKENDEQGKTSKESTHEVGNKEHEDKESQKEAREKEKDAVKLQKKELQIILEEKGDAESGKEDSVQEDKFQKDTGMKNEKEYSKSEESVEIEKVAEISDVEKADGDGKKDEEVFKCDESEEIEKVAEISNVEKADGKKDEEVFKCDESVI